MITFETVSKLALALPEVEASTSYRTPAFKVRGKLFARLREEGDVLVVRSDFDARERLNRSEPETYFHTPHYEKHPWVLVSLTRVDRTAMRELLETAWRLVAPTKLVAAHDAGSKPAKARRR